MQTEAKRSAASPAREFARAVLGYVLRGRLFSTDNHLPPAHHDVPADFSGVGIASCGDAAMDDYVIARLHELGVAQVRLDYSYDDDKNHTPRFLQALFSHNIKVMLHLVQPFEAAVQMHAEPARRQWRDFVSRTLDDYGQQVISVEIGSTINRKRWAGYTLPGFLAAWEIAHDEVRRRHVRLAGPSVTDFEPIYNIGLLALLENRNQLPDIHANNLFSERCTEPERYDHKIIGRRQAGLLRMNLVKKARLLQRIGKDHGVAEMQSPAAFWTLPRIERLLANGEQKQADYLARYMVLCAASGALAKAAWGPLICAREGLIDDGMPYPALERITHYANVSGKLSDLRVRPAFHAFKAFNRLLPSLHYEGAINTGAGLEIHAFASATERVHAVWTINGHMAALADIYDAGDLQAAFCVSRDGETFAELPEVATESPLYLHWPIDRNITTRPGAGVLEHVAIHRHVAGKSYYLFRENGWQGLILAKDAQEAAMLRTALHPEGIAPPPRETILRKARNAIWTIADARDPKRKLAIKQPVRMHPHKKLLDRFKPSKARRSWNGACELLRRGIDTAGPVAYFELAGDTTLTRNYYICEYVPADFSARDLLSAFASGQHEYMGIAEQDAYRQLCQYVLAMHNRGVFFRDLSGGNILITKSGHSTMHFSLIDTARAHFFNHPTALNKRISDLTRICNKLHWAGRIDFMNMYLDALGLKFGFARRLPFHIYDAKVAFKRRFGRKGIKRLLQR